MRARALILIAAVAWAAAQACSLDTQPTSSGPGIGFDAGADHSVDGTSAEGQAGTAGSAGTAGTAGAAGADGSAGSGGTAGSGGVGGADAGGSGGTGGLSPTLCMDCPAHQCGVDEACTFLVAGGGQGGADAGGAGGQADAGIDGSAGADAGGQGGTADAGVADAGGAADAGAADASSAPRAACLPRCNLASPSCPTGFTCRSLGGVTPVCYPDDPTQCTAGQANGTLCTTDQQCRTGHCNNGHCCKSGVCCATSADCPGSAATCTDPTTCQGYRTGSICQSNQCVSGTEPDDSACGSNVSVQKSCGSYQNGTCTGAVSQNGLVCATTCTNDATCVAPATCNLGHCCAPGRFDFDSDPSTCECIGTPSAGQGASCGGAIDLGSLDDSGQLTTVSANALPNRDVWYSFHAVDTPDTSCDTYHVRVRFVTNPGGGYQFHVLRGSCNSSAECNGGSFTDYEWATDMRKTIAGRLAGECPCTAPTASPVSNVSTCEDDGSDYFVEVSMKAGYVPSSCAPYVLEISNGAYKTP